MPEQNFAQANDSTLVLPVLVWGTAANGSIFREHVTAEKVTQGGALLTGMPYPISVGDLVGLQYKECKAHARVSKTPQLSGNNRWSLWVELLETSRCPWAGLETNASGSFLCPVKQGQHRERRQYPRYPLSLPVHIQTDDGGAPMFFKTKDISACGCYIETIFPLLKGVEVTVILRLDSALLVCTGLVRTADVNVGMGIEFVELSDTARSALSNFIQSHDGNHSPDLMTLASEPALWLTTEAVTRQEA